MTVDDVWSSERRELDLCSPRCRLRPFEYVESRRSGLSAEGGNRSRGRGGSCMQVPPARSRSRRGRSCDCSNAWTGHPVISSNECSAASCIQVTAWIDPRCSGVSAACLRTHRWHGGPRRRGVSGSRRGPFCDMRCRRSPSASRARRSSRNARATGSGGGIEDDAGGICGNCGAAQWKLPSNAAELAFTST